MEKVIFVFMEEKDCVFNESMECRGYNHLYGCSCNQLCSQSYDGEFLRRIELEEEGELV